MLAIHDRFTRQMRRRLKTTCMGLGLVRLLQDARRFDEAKATLYSLEDGFQVGENSTKPSKAIRLKGTRTDAAETLPQPLSIA
jgi:hypothetical protein